MIILTSLKSYFISSEDKFQSLSKFQTTVILHEMSHLLQFFTVALLQSFTIKTVLIFIVQRALNDLIIESSTDLWSFVTWVRWFLENPRLARVIIISKTFKKKWNQWQKMFSVNSDFNFTLRIIIYEACLGYSWNTFVFHLRKKVWIDLRVTKWWHFRFWVNYSFNYYTASSRRGVK